MSKSSQLIEKIESEIGILKDEREKANWSDKETACSLVRHRVGGLNGFEKIEIYDDNPIGYKDHVVNGIMGAMYPRDGQWFSYAPWGQVIEMNRESRRLSSIGSRPGATQNGQKRRRQLEARIAGGDIRTLDDIDGAKDAIQDVVAKVHTLYMYNGYYNAKEDQVKDAYVLGFGVSMTCCEMSGKKSRIYQVTFNPKECYIQLDASKSRCEVFAREFTMTTNDIWIKWYDSPTLPSYISEERQKGINSAYTINEFICPRGYLKDYDTGEVLGSDKFRYQHFVFISGVHERNELNGSGFIEYNGYDEMPISVLWFNRHENHPYGVGVVESCIDEIVKLNDISRIKQEIMQYEAEPMWAVPLSALQSFVAAPGMQVPVSSSDQVPVPLQSGKNNVLVEDMFQQQLAILKERMWLNIFQTLLSNTDSRKTATEVNYLKNEAAQIATGMIGNSQECANMEFKRSVALLRKLRYIHFSSKEIETAFNSCVLRFNTQFINQIQNFYMISGSAAFISYLQAVAPLDSGVLDVIDTDMLTRDYASALSINEYDIREKSEVEQRRKMRSELAQQQLASQLSQQNSQANYNNARASQITGAGNAAAGL